MSNFLHAFRPLLSDFLSTIFFAVFYADEQTRAKVIYEIEPRVLLAETERQLDGSRNAISHVGFTERWARANGKIVYADRRQAND